MRAHTITTQARVPARVRTKRTLVPGGTLALSLAVVLLATTASTASAKAILVGEYGSQDRRAPFDFGDRQVGTASPVLHFDLRVGCGKVAGCNTTFSPRISVPDQFAQTNNCPPTLESHQQVANSRVDCNIEVTFTPTSTGPKQGTLSTGPGGPSVALAGTGVTTPTPPVLPPRLYLQVEEWSWCGWRCKPDDYFRSRAELGKRPLVLEKKLKFFAITNNYESESTVEVSGGVKRTTKQFRGGETEITAKLQHPKRLNEGPKRGNPRNCSPVRRGCTTVKLNVAMTDGFGQTDTEEVRVTLYRNPTL